ncbi:MAG: Phosphatidylserine decarboxylase proenzyme [Candidatus Methanoperedenaceae archaeon GB37]|nr:MAG: Phosphatidylserine decarboxylase proenzyme [Candidatus Methanoperedenaceae archaeon GB37]
MHKSGWPLVISAGIVSFFLFLWRWYIVAIGGGILTAFLAYFFRDPERNITENEKAIVSPADGPGGISRLIPFGQR